MAAKKSSAGPVAKLLRDLHRKSKLQQEFFRKPGPILRKYGVGKKELQAVQDCVRVYRELGDAVFHPMSPWPPPGSPKIVVESMTPALYAGKKTRVTITGSGFPKDSQFAIWDSYGKTKYMGEVDSVSSTELVGKIVVDERGDSFTLVVGDDEAVGDLAVEVL